MTGKTRHPSVRRRKPQATAKATPATEPARDLKIGEAAKQVGVETFVLRFWETQFPFLKPKHTRTKHRAYQDRDVEVLRLIKRLLHDEGFTIAGANKHIREIGLDDLLAGKSKSAAVKSARQASTQETSRANSSTLDGPARRVLSELREDLKTIKKLLEK
jgi:DNA-binding transcriptional MerR regulator